MKHFLLITISCLLLSCNNNKTKFDTPQNDTTLPIVDYQDSSHIDNTSETNTTYSEPEEENTTNNSDELISYTIHTTPSTYGINDNINDSRDNESRDYIKYRIKGFYEEVDASDDYDIIEDDRYFEEISTNYGRFEAEISDKVSSELYEVKVKGTNVFVLFEYNTSLCRFDEGIIISSGNSGIFYKKP